MRLRSLAVLVSVVVACCGGSLSSAQKQAQEEQDARNAAAAAVAEAFAPHLSAYLDPQWTQMPSSGSADKLEGNRNGKLVIVNADTRALHCGIVWTVGGNPSTGLDSPKMATPGMYASVPEEVGTVVLVWSTSVAVGTYTDGSIGYRDDFKVRVVNLDSREIIDDGYVLGSKPVDTKFGKGDVHGHPPYCFSLDYNLRDMAVAAAPTPAPTPLVYVVKSGDTLSRIATANNVTVDQILEANPKITKSSKLKVGDQILIPAPLPSETVD